MSWLRLLPPHCAAPLPRTGLRVLLVDDKPANRRAGVGLLTGLGCYAAAASGGAEALELLEGEGFDVVLMDCDMPDMDGFAATRALRAHEEARLRDLPIFGLSAGARGDRDRAAESDMDRLLTKPISREELGAALAAVAPQRAEVRGEAEAA
jgi:CheY-like chemotaxis protein